MSKIIKTESIDKKYSRDANWTVPLNPDACSLIFEILGFLKDSKYEIKNFKTVFGCPLCRMSSGRNFESLKFSYSTRFLEETIKKFLDFGIGVRLTMQKYNVTDEDINDKTVNEILDLLNSFGNGKNNGVIVSSDKALDYIKANYENLNVISSIIKPSIEIGLWKDTPEYYNNLIKNYDLVVVNAARVFDKEFTDKISDIKKIEVITNSNCSKNCRQAGKDYLHIEKRIETILTLDKNSEEFKIAIEKSNKTREALGKSCLKIKKDNLCRNGMSMNTDQVDYLSQIGIQNFKLEGREYSPSALISDIAYYMTERNLFYRFIDRRYF